MYIHDQSKVRLLQTMYVQDPSKVRKTPAMVAAAASADANMSHPPVLDLVAQFHSS
jgi:hypothetical protein